MATPRRKAARIDAPATLDEAIALIAEYLEVSAAVEQIRADADASIRQIEEARDALIAPAEAALKAEFAQLRTWWAVARDALTDDGKRKSVELAGALIGDRTGTPALKLPKGWRAEYAVGFIASLGDTWAAAEALLRTKREIDKPAMIKLLGNASAVGPMIERIVEEGFAVTQKEEFFITRAAERMTDPIVETEEVAS